MTVRVALFSTAYAPFVGGPAVANDAGELAYDELPQVEVDIGDEGTLGAAIDKAAEAFGISLEDDFPRTSERVSEVVGGVALYHPDHPPLWHKAFPAIDKDGHVYWAQIEDVQLVDLKRAEAKGLLDGDPERVYFQPFPPAGAIDLAEWQTVLAALGSLWALMKVMTEGREALETLKAIRDRIWRGREAVDARHVQWSDRGVRPGRLEVLLRVRSWRSDELAVVLDCTPEEAEAILWSFGFVADDAGIWHVAGDTAAVLISDAIETSMSDVARVGTPEQLERLYMERIDAYLLTGEFPEPPWHDLEHWYWDE